MEPCVCCFKFIWYISVKIWKDIFCFSCFKVRTSYHFDNKMLYSCNWQQLLYKVALSLNDSVFHIFTMWFMMLSTLESPKQDHSEASLSSITGFIICVCVCVSIFYCALNCNAFKLLLIGHIYQKNGKMILRSTNYLHS